MAESNSNLEQRIIELELTNESLRERLDETQEQVVIALVKIVTLEDKFRTFTIDTAKSVMNQLEQLRKTNNNYGKSIIEHGRMIIGLEHKTKIIDETLSNQLYHFKMVLQDFSEKIQKIDLNKIDFTAESLEQAYQRIEDLENILSR